MQGRAVLGRKLGTFSEADELESQSPLRKLKTLFPNSPLNKHTPMDIYLTAPSPGRPRALIFRDMGAIESDWVATEFVLAYFEGQGLSPPVCDCVRIASMVLTVVCIAQKGRYREA